MFNFFLKMNEMSIYQGFNTLLFQLRVVSVALLVLLNLASAKNVQGKTMKIHSRNTTTVKFKAVIHFYDCNCLLTLLPLLI